MVTRIDPVLSVVAFIHMILVAVTTTILGGELHRRFTKRQEAFPTCRTMSRKSWAG